MKKQNQQIEDITPNQLELFPAEQWLRRQTREQLQAEFDFDRFKRLSVSTAITQ